MQEKDELTWLTRWYSAQCNGDWEHSFGVRIDTLDNPGWTLKIDLADTPLRDRPFVDVAHGEIADDLEEWRTSGSWWICKVRDHCFDAACGPHDLAAVIGVFRGWVGGR